MHPRFLFSFQTLIEMRFTGQCGPKRRLRRRSYTSCKTAQRRWSCKCQSDTTQRAPPRQPSLARSRLICRDCSPWIRNPFGTCWILVTAPAHPPPACRASIWARSDFASTTLPITFFPLLHTPCSGSCCSPVQQLRYELYKKCGCVRF